MVVDKIGEKDTHECRERSEKREKKPGKKECRVSWGGPP